MKFKLTIFFLVLVMHPLFAQQPAFRQLSIQDGLPSENIYYAFQDQLGHLWFGTDRGVSRFDGQQFYNYNKSDGLSDNEIFSIHEDKKGRIWFLTNNGIPGYFADGQFRSLKNEISEAPPGALTYCFMDDGTSNYYFGNNKGLLKISAKEDGFETFENWPFKRIFHLWQGVDWQKYALSDEGIIKVNEDSTFLLTYKFEVPLSFSKATTAPSGELFFSSKQGLFSFDLNKGVKVIHPSPENEIIAVNWINEELWLGKRKGVFQLESKGGEWVLKDSFLIDKSITSIEKDFEGGYWFSTLNDGVFYTSTLRVKRSIDIEHCKDCHISFIKFSPDGELWVGGHDGFLMKQSDAGKESWKIVYPYNNSTGMEINDIFFYKGETWIATNGPCTRIIPEGENIYSRPGAVRSVLINENDQIYLASTTGLWCLPWTYFKTSFLYSSIKDIKALDKYRISDFRSTKIFRDKTGKIWLGTTQGLYFFKDEKLIPFKTEKLNADIHVTDIAEIGQFLVVATSGDGLYFLSQEVTYHFQQKDGLSGNFCNTLYIDDAEQILAGTSKGISVFEIGKTGPEILPFTDLGLSDVNAICLKKNTVYTGTSHGLVSFARDLLQPKAIAPKFYLQRIMVNNKVSPSIEVLAYDQNQLQFIFKGISFAGNSSVEYQYLLKGLHDNWQFTSNPHLDFASLAPGKYKLKARACFKNSDNCSETISCSFLIRRPFWATWWFFLISLCLIGGIIYSFFKIRILTYNRDVVRELIQLINNRLKKEQYITIKDITDGSKAKIVTHKIKWIESNRNYITVYLNDKQVTSRAPLKEIESLLQQQKSNSCLRIHRSYIVNKKYIDAWHSTFVKIGEKHIPIGPNYKNQLEEISN